MTVKLAVYIAVLANKAFCATSWGIYIFQIWQDRVNAASMPENIKHFTAVTKCKKLSKATSQTPSFCSETKE